MTEFTLIDRDTQFVYGPFLTCAAAERRAFSLVDWMIVDNSGFLVDISAAVVNKE